MVKDTFHKSGFPEDPVKIDRGNQSSSEDSDYYIRTTVQAMMLKYGGRRKGKEITLNDYQYSDFLKLQSIFGKKFTLNEIICAGYYLMRERGVPSVDEPDVPLNSKHVSFKPTEEALYAVAKTGGLNAFNKLISIGLVELCKIIR
jgi:hypothetical protein